MNYILYLLDGLTPLSIKNSENIKFIGKKINKNYLSKLQEDSINFNNCYGYGETFATTYQYFTGADIYQSNCDAFHLFNSFPVRKNLAFFFKKKNFNTFMYRDANENHPLGGFYGRYFKSIAKNFDYVSLKKKNKDYDIKNFISDQKIQKYLNQNNNNFFLIHDYSLHDNPKAYQNATPKSYLEAVNQSALTVESNLKKIKYDQKKDVLIFLSDHGLNLSPYDKMHFKKKLPKFYYNNYYSNLLANEKIKTTFFIKYPKILKRNIKKFITPDSVFNLIKDLPSNNLKNQYVNNFLKKLDNKKIILSYRAAEQDPFNNFFFKNYFHCHFLFFSKKKKFSYSHNHPDTCYDYMSKKKISIDKIDKNFSIFIKNYFSIKNLSLKIINFIFSIFLRFILKIIKI